MKNIHVFVRKLRATKARSRRVGLLSLGLVLVVLLSACGGGSTPANHPTNTPAVSQGGNAGQGGARGDSEFGLTEAEVARRVDAVESLIATCMRDAGFEYIPVDYATARAAMDSNSKPSGLNADEFRAQFGYGITTQFASTDSQAVTGAGAQNTRIRSGLSPADRVAYDHVLYGENPSATFVVSLDGEDFSQTGGCTRAAVEKVFSPEELGPGFANYQNTRDARIDQDPRVIAAQKDWAACMREAGYSYANSGEIRANLANRLEAITGGADPATLPADAQAALAALQGEELAIAAADHECSIKFVDPITTQVETELLGPAGTNQ
ncbi:MAG: hypothetical protein H8D78_02130 [Chloroflexi bacterium]|nr:hypothetical protein [Chloroflexota bacterium]